MKLRMIMGTATALAVVSGASVFAASRTPSPSVSLHAPTFAGKDLPAPLETAHPAPKFLLRRRKLLLKEVASTLAITPATLRLDLRNDQSLASIAQVHGLNQATLASDLETTLKATLNAKVSTGHVSAARATRIEAVVSRHINTWLQLRGNVWLHLNRREQFVHLVSPVLKMKPLTLLTDLRQGSTIAAIAQQQGMSETTLQSAVESAMQSHLAERVQSGKISSSQEQQDLAHFDAHVSHRLTTPWITKTTR